MSRPVDRLAASETPGAAWLTSGWSTPSGRATPSTENVTAGRFPLLRVLSPVSADEPEGLTARFLDYARSGRVHDLVEAQGFAPVRRETRLTSPRPEGS